MKGAVHIGGAVVLGMIIILGSLYARSGAETPQPASNLLAHTQTPIEARDENNNGIPDWEESVRDTIFKSINTPTSTAATGFEDVEYTPPTTLTGKFSEAFLQDYLEGKMDGKDFSDPEAFVNGAVSAIEASVQSKKHTRAELTIVSTNAESVRAYGNAVVEIMNRHSVPSEPELAILEEAVQKNDPEVLKKLVPIQTGYSRIIADTLRMPVPDTLALAHIALLNAYEAVYTDIASMQHLFDDPLLALARVRVYPDDADALLATLRNISTILDTHGAVYTSTEPGSFFYIFDAL